MFLRIFAWRNSGKAYLCLHSKQTLKKGTSYGRIYSTQKETIPYGMMNFAVIRRDNCYYVDKTRFIPIIEDADKFFFFNRPRRFGKSLTVKFISSSMSTTTLPMPSPPILRVCIVTPTRHMAKAICAPSSTR